MIHKRIITLNGDENWVKRTLANSLPEGPNIIFNDPARIIHVDTTLGDALFHPIPANKPEQRFDKEIKIHLLMFDDGSGTGRVEKASFDGGKINRMVDECNGEGSEGLGPYYAINVELI